MDIPTRCEKKKKKHVYWPQWNDYKTKASALEWKHFNTRDSWIPSDQCFTRTAKPIDQKCDQSPAHSQCLGVSCRSATETSEGPWNEKRWSWCILVHDGTLSHLISRRYHGRKRNVFRSLILHCQYPSGSHESEKIISESYFTSNQNEKVFCIMTFMTIKHIIFMFMLMFYI